MELALTKCQHEGSESQECTAQVKDKEQSGCQAGKVTALGKSSMRVGGAVR